MQTVAQPVEFEQVIRRSRFIGRLVPVEDRSQAALELERIRDRVPGARHHAAAIRVDGEPLLEHATDDGEPSGTAGRPILEVLRRHDLVDVLLVVSRVFGGVLLGAPGLVRAYAGTAALVVKAATLVPLVRTERLELDLSYPDWARVEAWVREAAIAVEVEFAGGVRARVRVPADLAGQVTERLVQATGGRARVSPARPPPGAG